MWSAILGIISGLLKFLNFRSDAANKPEIVEQKKAQQEQNADDELERLTHIALSDPDPKKREEALEQLRKLEEI